MLRPGVAPAYRSLRAAVAGARLRRMTRPLLVLLAAALLVACSPHPAGEATAGAPAGAATNALAGTPLATYGHDLNRAKNVQAIVNQQAKRQAAAVEAQSGSSSH